MNASRADVIVGAIVMAAGRSTRLASNKLIADLSGKTVIAHAMDAIVRAPLPAPIVVLGHAAPAIRAALAGYDVRFVSAPHYADGMAHSLAAGIAAIPADWQAVLICLGDMPFIAPELIARLAAQASTDAIALPVHDGRRGNPVLWGRNYFPELAALTGDTGARTLFGKYAGHIREVEWPDASIHRDIDTEAALAEARGIPG